MEKSIIEKMNAHMKRMDHNVMIHNCGIYEKYHNDPVFHALTELMVAHMMNNIVSFEDFISAANMAKGIVLEEKRKRQSAEDSYGCLLNLLKEKYEKKYGRI